MTQANCTWSFEKPACVTLYPKDQRIINTKKVTENDYKMFQKLYMTFETRQDEAGFSVQVTFPEEEQHERRRRQA